MTRYHIRLSSCELNLERDPPREPPRPAALRHPDYEDDFDFTTLFYDVFWNSAHDAILLIGPPSFNLRENLGLQIRAYPSRAVCEQHILGSVMISRSWVEVPTGTTGIVLQAGENEFYITPQPNLSNLFRNRRVVTTLNKDNPLQWIADWATFYRKIHKCDGILIYDNNSSLYSTPQLYDALRHDHAMIVIVPWAFKYGVSDWRKPLSTGFNDSLYAQPGMLEHARLRFLAEAKSGLNADIDELVITQSGSSVFGLVENSATGYLEFPGRWVENYPCGAEEKALSRHRDFSHIERPERIKCKGKWAVVPHKTPPAAQWDIHTILGMTPTDPEEGVELRHFRAINTNWSAHRSWSETPRTAAPIDPNKLSIDAILRAALDKAFREGDETSPSAEEAVPRSWSAYRLRVRAGPLAAEKKWDEAIEAVRAASDLMPEHSGLHLYLADLHTQAGDASAAQRQSARGSALRERDPWYHFQQGRWHQAQGELDSARQCFERAIKADPLFTLAYSHLAKVEAKLGRPDMTLSLLNACLEQAPHDPMAHVLLAEELEKEKRLPDALKCWETAARLDPTNAHSLGQRARLLRRLGRLTEAEEALRKAIACDSLSMQMNILEDRWSIPQYLCAADWHRPTAPELLAELAELMIEKRDLDAAETVARRALADRRKGPERYLRLAEILLRRGKKATVDAAVKAGLANHPAFRERLAKLLMESGQDEEAEQVLLSARELEPQNAELYFRLSQVLKRRQRLDRAVDAVRRAIELDPLAARFRDHLAALLQQQDEPGGAEDVLRQALDVGVESGAIHYRLSRLLRKRGCLAEALTSAAAAVRLEPDKVERRRHWAMLLLDAGREEDAEQVLVEALEIEPENGELHFSLSQVLQRCQRQEEALQAAQRAIETEPQAAKFRDHLAALLAQRSQITETSDPRA